MFSVLELRSTAIGQESTTYGGGLARPGLPVADCRPWPGARRTAAQAQQSLYFNYGASSYTTWTDIPVLNWSASSGGLGGTYTNYTDSYWIDGCNAYFEGTPGAVTVSGSIAAVNSITFTADGYTLNGGTINLTGAGGNITTGSGIDTISSVLTGNVGLTKLGSGMLVLTGTGSNYTGGTFVSAGTLQCGNGWFNSLPATTVVTLGSSVGNSNGVLDLASDTQTVGGLITAGTGTANQVIDSQGGGGLTLSITGVDTFGGQLGGGASNSNFALILSNGILVLTNSGNIFNGKTTISGGTLSFSAAGDLGSGTTAIVLGANSGSQGELSYTGAAALNFTRGFAVNNTGGGQIDNSGAGLLTISGSNITSTSGNLTISGSGNTTISSFIQTYAGSLTKIGAGVLTLANTNNTYTGTTTIGGGTLSIGNIVFAGGLGNATSPVTLSGGGDLSYTGTSVTYTRGFTIGAGGGEFDVTSGATTVTTTNALSLASGGMTFGGAGNTSYAGVISGANGVTVVGNGTVTLAATNTYSGQTNVNNGILSISSSANLGSGAAGNSLSISGGTLLSTATPVTLGVNQTLVAAGPATLNFSAATNAFTLGGGLSGANTVTFNGGNVTINTPTPAFAGAVVYNSSGNNITGLTLSSTGDLTGAASITLTNSSQTSGGTGIYFNLTSTASQTFAVPITMSDAYATARLAIEGSPGAGNTLALTGSITLAGAGLGSCQIYNNAAGTAGIIAVNGNVTGSASTFTLRGTGQFVVNGLVNIGTTPLTVTDNATVYLNTAGTWGATTDNYGTFKLGAANVLPAATTVNLGQGSDSNADMLDLQQYSQSIYELAFVNGAGGVGGTKTVTASTGPATLAIGAGGIVINPVVSGTLALGGSVTVVSPLLSYTGTGATTVSGGTLNLSGGTINSTSVAATNITTISAILTGSSGLAIQANGTTNAGGNGGYLSLTNANSFTGGITILSGIVNPGTTDASFGAASSPVILNGGGLVASANSVYAATRNIQLATNASGYFRVFNTDTLTVNGLIGGAGTLQKSDAGALNVTGSNTYSGGTVVLQGTLLASNTAGSATGSGAVTINSGAILSSGTGSSGIVAGNVTLASGALLTPGGAGTIGTLTLQGGLATASGGTLSFDLTTPGGSGDLINVSGGSLNFGTGAGVALTANGVTNSLSPGNYRLFQYTVGTTTVANSGNVTFTGGLPRQLAQYSFTPDSTAGYLDVSVTSLAATTAGWNINNGGSWATATNWLPNVSPAIQGDIANLGNILTTAGTITLDSQPHVGTLTFYPGSGGAYTLNAGVNNGTLIMDNTGSTAYLTNSAGSNTVNAPITLLAPATALTVSGGSLTVNSAVSGTGVLISAVNAGMLRLGSATALGPTGGSASVASGGFLDLNGQTIANVIPLTLNGSGAGGNGALINSNATAASFAGSVTLAGSTTVAPTSGNITLSGSITGAYPLIASGANTLILSGANNFSGGLYVKNGTVQVNNTAGVLGGATGTVYLGDTGGTNNVTLAYAAGGAGVTNTNPINVQAGNSGTITISDNSGNGVNFNGAVTLNGGKTLNIGNTNTAASAFSFGGGFSGSGSLNFTNMGLAGDTITLATNPVNMIGTITNSATTGAVTISANIGPNVGLIRETAGALTLSGTNNTNSGGVTLTAGNLTLSSSTALGATAGTLTINGGTLNSGTAGLVIANNNPQVWNSGFTFQGGQSLNLGTGPVSLGTSASTSCTLTVTASTLAVGGLISNGTTTNSLITAGAGTLVLYNTNNAYSGGNVRHRRHPDFRQSRRAGQRARHAGRWCNLEAVCRRRRLGHAQRGGDLQQCVDHERHERGHCRGLHRTGHPLRANYALLDGRQQVCRRHFGRGLQQFRPDHAHRDQQQHVRSQRAGFRGARRFGEHHFRCDRYRFEPDPGPDVHRSGERQRRHRQDRRRYARSGQHQQHLRRRRPGDQYHGGHARRRQRSGPGQFGQHRQPQHQLRDCRFPRQRNLLHRADLPPLRRRQ